MAIKTPEVCCIINYRSGIHCCYRSCKEMLWMKRFLLELGVKQDEYVVFCDSQSAIDLSKNATYHSQTKHIDVRYHWLCEVIDKK
jgi:hypothetical protein